MIQKAKLFTHKEKSISIVFMTQYIPGKSKFCSESKGKIRGESPFEGRTDMNDYIEDKVQYTISKIFSPDFVYIHEIDTYMFSRTIYFSFGFRNALASNDLQEMQKL